MRLSLMLGKNLEFERRKLLKNYKSLLDNTSRVKLKTTKKSFANKTTKRVKTAQHKKRSFKLKKSKS